MEQSSFGVSTDNRLGLKAPWVPIGAVILSAILSWLWFLPGISAQLTAKDAVAAEASTLDRVGSEDIANALRTMDGSAEFLAQFKARKDGCPVPLAWVSLARAAKSQPEGLRITSGNYVSPEFDVSDVPVRIAIPFPAPYEVGHGTFEVISVGSGATVALSPALHVASGTQKIVRQVVWDPAKRCSPTNEQ